MCRYGNEQESTRRKDSRALLGITSRVHRNDEVNARIQQRQATIGVCDGPRQIGESPRGMLHRRTRQVEPQSINREIATHVGEGVTRTRSEISGDCTVRQVERCGTRHHGVGDLTADAGGGEPRARGDRCR